MLKQCQDSYHSTFGTYEDMSVLNIDLEANK